LQFYLSADERRHPKEPELAQMQAQTCEAQKNMTAPNNAAS